MEAVVKTDSISNNSVHECALKGIVDSQLKFPLFPTHPDVSGDFS